MVHRFLLRGLRARAAAASGLLLALAVSVPAAAQTVRGTLVNEADAAPLPGAAVALLDTAGVFVDSTRTTPDGSFILRTTRPGTYIVYFSHPGYASVPSSAIRLRAGETLERRFPVPLIGGAAIRRMGEVIDVEKRLQGDLAELCGERPRPWEAGILVGVVRERRGGEPLAEAVVRVEAPATEGGEPFRRATVSSANGVYVLCNVPPGTATMRTDLAGYRTDEGPVEVRAGDIGWYDVLLRRR